MPGQKREKIQVGGWAGIGYFDNDKENTNKTFDAHPWYFTLLPSQRRVGSFLGNWKRNTFSNSRGGGAEGDGELKLERSYAERNCSTAHNVRGGKFFLPFGYFYRAHWRFLTKSYTTLPHSIMHTHRDFRLEWSTSANSLRDIQTMPITPGRVTGPINLVRRTGRRNVKSTRSGHPKDS